MTQQSHYRAYTLRKPQLKNTHAHQCSSRHYFMCFPRSSVSKESACNARDLGSIPGLGGFPGAGNGSPLQYSSLENLMDRGAWRASTRGCKNLTRLSD